MIDCPECNGAGKIATSYREAAPQKPVVEKKEKSSMLDSAKVAAGKAATWFKNWWVAFIAVSVIGGVFTMMFLGIMDENKARALQKIEDAKHGYFIVQYDESNSVQRCWITPSKEEVVLVGKGAYAWVYDMDKPGDIPASIGVSVPSKCVRIQ